MFQRAAGQAYNGETPVSQWAWEPQSPTESLIRWGTPQDWDTDTDPYKEKFVHDGDWVYLEGWYDNQTFWRLEVTQWISDYDCKTNRQKLPPGRQAYVKWQVPAAGTENGYCLFAQGTIVDDRWGIRVMYAHQQKWSAGTVSTKYFGTIPALKQNEVWWDDRGSEFRVKLRRDCYIGKGKGMALRIDNFEVYKPWVTKSRYDLKHTWTY
ncbi:hypothetical protein [Prauserella endophytica]|uniref:Uncharacterized protein n=1 Tax=Prauserella endophytica TaxID=1592324 RepID=A0ABY2RSU6_9PSEU|nr:hypothetical protein [Prauserella endophytica]TKG58905.1 hypothetical protein FCN18_37465 [Prauserella endophytica]